MKFVVALDSLKGCLSAPEACQAVAEGLRAAHPDAEIIQLPMSDGGEGLTEVLSHAATGQWVSATVHGPLAEPTEVRYFLSQQTACMEMASACGLPLVPESQRNPLHATTYGLGEMMADAIRRGAHHIIIGIGGSATNDAGIGMLQALGYRFYDSNHRLFTEPLTGACLEKIHSVQGENNFLAGKAICLTVACDVQNPLFGPNGAAYIFAPQKGADAETIKRLDNGLRSFAEVSARFLGKDCALQPGTGAAGGLGFALTAYLNATLRPGIALVMDALHFHEQIENADWIITGEGKSDRQTLMGKVPAGILKAAQTHGVPVALMAGHLDDEAMLRQAGFARLININEGRNYTLAEAMRPETAQMNLKTAAFNVF